MKVAIGSDHGGHELKRTIIDHFTSKKISFIDVGIHNKWESADYPLYAAYVAEEISTNRAEKGILVCGTGIGMSIAANKFKGIRATLVHDVFSAKATREHNDSNILCMGQRVIGEEVALMIVDMWLSTEFEGERHQKRIDLISKYES